MHKYLVSSRVRCTLARRRQSYLPLEVPRGTVIQEGYRSPDSDATPTQAGVGSSCEPHASEAEGSCTSPRADANRLRVPPGSSRPGAGERAIRWAENGSHDGGHSRGWEVEVPEATCDVSISEDL